MTVEIFMKRATLVAFLFCMIGAAAAGTDTAINTRQRLADAAADSCAADCANTNASCKRVCPTTFGAPCLSSCDNQALTCRQSCQSKESGSQR
jgi:hypothetical protein